MTLGSVFMPYHEHMNAVPIVMWDRLTAVFGSSSPSFLLVLLLTHVALATGTAGLLIARVGPAAGFSLALPLALLGSAHYDLVMPWQIVFTIPLLCGLVAVWLSMPPARTLGRRLGVCLALTIGVCSSNAGLFVIFALLVWFLFDDRRLQVWELVPPSVVWLAWFVTVGVTGLQDDGAAHATLDALIPYVVTGIASGLGGLGGLGPPFGGLVLVCVLWWVVARRPFVHPAMAGFALAIIALFAAASLFRSYGSAEQATASRYVYLVGYFIAFGVAVAAPRIWQPHRLIPVAILAAGLNMISLASALPTYP